MLPEHPWGVGIGNVTLKSHGRYCTSGGETGAGRGDSALGWSWLLGNVFGVGICIICGEGKSEE